MARGLTILAGMRSRPNADRVEEEYLDLEKNKDHGSSLAFPGLEVCGWSTTCGNDLELQLRGLAAEKFILTLLGNGDAYLAAISAQVAGQQDW